MNRMWECDIPPSVFLASCKVEPMQRSSHTLGVDAPSCPPAEGVVGCQRCIAAGRGRSRRDALDLFGVQQLRQHAVELAGHARDRHLRAADCLLPRLADNERGRR